VRAAYLELVDEDGDGVELVGLLHALRDAIVVYVNRSKVRRRVYKGAGRSCLKQCCG
jgi:hypothetical protein